MYNIKGLFMTKMVYRDIINLQNNNYACERMHATNWLIICKYIFFMKLS